MAKRLTDITELLDKARGITEPAALLDALLDAYRKRPLPELAKLIVLAGKRAAVDHPMKGSLNDQHAMWKGVAVLKRAMDVDWLIANVITGRAEYSIERIQLLEKWPEDPRMSSQLLALANGKQMTSRQARSFWKYAFNIIGGNIHVALASILAPMLALAPQTEFETWLLKKLHVTQARIGRLEIASPSTKEKASLAKLSELLGQAKAKAAAKTAEDFLKEIWANPNDDGPRAVFADWLQEQGDPRGEFITLQLSRSTAESKSRANALLKQHGKQWSAPFEAILSHPNSKFERGFLSFAYVHWRKLASVPQLMRHPAWATVRRFKVDPEGAEAVDKWIDHMIDLGASRG